MEFPVIFNDAMKLPTGAYYTPKLARVKPSQAMLVRMDGTAITNATSEVPVIGTAAFNPCGAMILYNTRSKTGIITHQPWPDGDEFNSLLRRIRGNKADQVEVHIVGIPKATPRDNDDPDGMNEMRVRYLTSILNAITKTENVTLKTFDVFNKLHPHAVAIDTRNGNIIRGSKLFITEGEGNRIQDHFDWPCAAEQGEDFDGTVPELQRPRRRT